MSETESRNGKTPKILGFSLFGVSLVIFLATYAISWYFRIGILHHWYFFVAMPIIFIAIAVFAFVLPGLAKIIQPLLFLAFIIDVAIVFWLATYQKHYRGVHFEDIQGEIGNKGWIKHNRVYILYDSRGNIAQGDTVKIGKEKITEKVKEALKKYEEQIKTQKDKMEKIKICLSIDLKDTEMNIKDVELAFNILSNYWYSKTMQRGFVNITGPNMAEVAKDKGGKKVKESKEFYELYKKITGKDLVAGGSTTTGAATETETEKKSAAEKAEETSATA